VSRWGSRPPPRCTLGLRWDHKGTEASPVPAVLSQDPRAPPWQVPCPRSAPPRRPPSLLLAHAQPWLCALLPPPRWFASRATQPGEKAPLPAPPLGKGPTSVVPTRAATVGAFPLPPRLLSFFSASPWVLLLSELRFKLSLFQFFPQSKNRGGVSLFSQG